MEIDECLQVARRLEQSGAHALVLSGGFVSKAPMYVMRGEMPIRTMDALHDAVVAEVRRAHGGQVDDSHRPLQGSLLPDDALRFRQELKMPLVYVGGLVARKKIDEVLDCGFEAVQMGRALLNDPGFVNRMRDEDLRPLRLPAQQLLHRTHVHARHGLFAAVAVNPLWYVFVASVSL